MRKFLLLVLVLLTARFVVAQHPFSTKWSYVNTPRAKVIFPTILEPDALRVAESMQSVFEADTVSLSTIPKKVPILLSNTNTISNGYATLSPYKLVWYNQPYVNTNLSSNEWFQTLAVHEYRHIVQFSALRTGLTKLAYCIAGAFGQNAFSYSVPQWFYEGDAVYAETVLTSQGRGRTADFESLTSAILCSNKNLFPYDKALHQSYRDYLPNHYPLGYQMVTNARREFGADILERVIKRQSWYSFWPYAFGCGFHHFTGLRLGQQYVKTSNELKKFYSDRIDSIGAKDYEHVNKNKKKFYTNYTCPRFLNDTLLICIKNSLAKTKSFVTINPDGTETKICGTDASTFDTDGKILVYASEVPDLRWTLQNFSDIAVVDINAGRRQLVTKKQKYFEPTLSEDGQKIAVVEFDKFRNCKLVILKLEKGNFGYTTRVVRTLQCMPCEYLRCPKFIGNDRVAFVSNFDNKNSIKVWNINEKSPKNILANLTENIGDLNYHDGKILYVSDFSGIGNVYQVGLDGEESEMLTNVKFQANYPVVSKSNSLYFCNYSALGNDIALVKDYKKIDRQEPCREDYFKPLLKYEPAACLDFIATHKADSAFEIKPYRQFSDPVRIYGWMPDVGVDYAQASVFSSNTLGTLDISATEFYNFDFGYFRTSASLDYIGFYPVIGLGISVGENADNFLIPTVFGNFFEPCYWRENVFSANVMLPFDLSRFNYNQDLNFNLGIMHYNISKKPFSTFMDLGNGNFPVVMGSLSYDWHKFKAYRDFENPLEFSADVNYQEALSKYYDAKLLSLSAGFRVPGIFRQNYLAVNGKYIRQTQNQQIDEIYLFDHQAFQLDGYESLRFQKLSKLSAAYSFPMGYPDIGIPSVFWIKRFRGSIFASVADGALFGENLKFVSAGFKILADFNILRLSNNFTSGISVSRGFKKNGLETTDFGLIFTYSM